jgi:type II secretory ATPase GspE/PulE/Tfp pilus assembly ATPase PilB-like protein
MRLGGGHDRRRRHELALWCRELALLLRNGTDLVTSLSILEHQDFSPAVRRMTTEMLQQAEREVPVETLFAGRDDTFPPVVVFALRLAQGPQGAAETLRDLADCLAEAADLGMTLNAPAGESRADDAGPLPEQAPIVRMVDSILRQALKVGATEVDIRPAADKELTCITYNINGRWEPMVELPVEMLGPICRRLCIMGKVNWWFREPALGTLTIDHGGEQVHGSVRYVPGAGEDDQQVCIAFADAPAEAEPS